MDIKGLLITRTKGEMLSGFVAVVSVVLGIVSAVVAKETRFVAIGALTVLCLSAVTVFGFLITRPAFTVRGYANVMAILSRIAATSRYRLWTVRSHTGAGVAETAYFQAIEDRMRDRERPLEDFRRIIRLCVNARSDMEALVSAFCRHDNASVYYYENCGPQFDFMIVDGRIGVIGFPMLDGRGNIGAIVLRSGEAVKGLEIIFQKLCQESQLLFEGASTRGRPDELKLEQALADIFTSLSSRDR